jgi:hypothetical protein
MVIGYMPEILPYARHKLQGEIKLKAIIIFLCWPWVPIHPHVNFPCLEIGRRRRHTRPSSRNPQDRHIVLLILAVHFGNITARAPIPMDMDHENNAQQAFKAARRPLPSSSHLTLLSEMLLLYVFVHLLQPKNGSAVPIPNSPEPRALTDACDDINNCRKLFDIVWGCLATIFACTWVSVHPNVPPPCQSWLALLGRRLKMMLFAVLAPELIVGFAARQFLIARKLSKGELLCVFLL